MLIIPERGSLLNRGVAVLSRSFLLLFCSKAGFLVLLLCPGWFHKSHGQGQNWPCHAMVCPLLIQQCDLEKVSQCWEMSDNKSKALCRLFLGLVERKMERHLEKLKNVFWPVIPIQYLTKSSTTTWGFREYLVYFASCIMLSCLHCVP